MWYNSNTKEVRAEHKPYPTDLTDALRKEIAPLYSGMRNRKWSNREVTDAVLYIVKTGCRWPQLPHDIPPYQNGLYFFSRGAKSGLWEKILDHLVEKTRKDARRRAEPHYALIDSQSVKTVAPTRGYLGTFLTKSSSSSSTRSTFPRKSSLMGGKLP